MNDIEFLQRAGSKCHEKTSRGNVYDTSEQAWREADATRYHSGEPIEAFQCKVCGKWHIGKNPIRDRRYDTPRI